MRYVGRITVTILMVFAFLFEIVQFYLLEGFLYNKITLIALLPFSYLGWWLGEQYDLVKHASQHDALTGAYNRRFITEQFARISRRLARKKEKLALFVIDVNDFKLINDTYGHPAGDVVLKNIANTLLYIKKGKCKVVRWGGDEFLALVPVKKSQLSSVRCPVIDELMEELSLKLKRNIRVSSGRAVYPDDGSTLEALIAHADAQMYEVKELDEENRQTQVREIS